MTMLKIILITYFVMLFIDIVYGLIIAPTLRISLEFRLKALRDRCRFLWLMTDCKDDPAFRIVDDSLTAAIVNLRRLNLMILVKAVDVMEKEDVVSEKAHEVQRIIEQTNISELRDILRNLDKCTITGIMINSVRLIIWSLPLMVVACVLAVVAKGDIDFKKVLVWPVLFTAENRLDYTIAGSQ